MTIISHNQQLKKFIEKTEKVRYHKKERAIWWESIGNIVSSPTHSSVSQRKLICQSLMFKTSTACGLKWGKHVFSTSAKLRQKRILTEFLCRLWSLARTSKGAKDGYNYQDVLSKWTRFPKTHIFAVIILVLMKCWTGNKIKI